MLKNSKILLVIVAASALSGCNYFDTLSSGKSAASGQAAPASIRDQVIAVKADCEKTTQTKPQWYRCWIPKAERIHEAQGYPHMDLLKVHFSELTMINSSIEKGSITPDQGEAMIAQGMVRFNNAVIGREQAARDREMKNWKEFRGYVESSEPADPSLKK